MRHDFWETPGVGYSFFKNSVVNRVWSIANHACLGHGDFAVYPNYKEYFPEYFVFIEITPLDRFFSTQCPCLLVVLYINLMREEGQIKFLLSGLPARIASNRQRKEQESAQVSVSLISHCFVVVYLPALFRWRVHVIFEEICGITASACAFGANTLFQQFFPDFRSVMPAAKNLIERRRGIPIVNMKMTMMQLMK